MSKLSTTWVFNRFTVTIQQGPGTVIIHPGQNVELLCTVTLSDPSTQRTAWLIDQEGPYTIILLCNRIRDGYSAILGGSDLTVEDIKRMMLEMTVTLHVW